MPLCTWYMLKLYMSIFKMYEGREVVPSNTYVYNQSEVIKGELLFFKTVKLFPDEEFPQLTIFSIP